MFKIKNKIIGKSSPVYIIAEIGINHNGNLKLCKKMIAKAKKCGADAVKLQISNPKYSYCKNTKSYKIFTKNNLDIVQLNKVKNFCNKINITLFATPGDFQSLDIIKKLNFPAIKISSGLLTNLPLIKKSAETNLPIIISTGMAYFKEIKRAVEILKKRKKKNFAILKCTSLYPSPSNTVNLRSIKSLKKFKVPIGFSDHTQNNDACLAAVSLGATIIEKHFTYNKNYSVPDKKISADPREFKNLVNSIRNIEKLLGKEKEFPTPAEKTKRRINHRSIISVKSLKKGEKFDYDNIALKRSANGHLGLDPSFFFKILGKKSKKNLIKDTKIKKKHF